MAFASRDTKMTSFLILHEMASQKSCYTGKDMNCVLGEIIVWNMHLISPI